MRTYVPAILDEKKCPFCGKRFYVTSVDKWAYKDNVRNQNGNNNRECFCSWNCLQAYRRDKPKKLVRYRKSKLRGHEAEIVKARQDGMLYAEIGKMYGVSASTVRNYINIHDLKVR